MAKEDFIIHVASSDIIENFRNDYLETLNKATIVDRLHRIRTRLGKSRVKYVDKRGQLVMPPTTVTNVFGPAPTRTFYVADKFSLATALAYYMSDDRNLSEEEREMDNCTDVLAELIARTGTATLEDAKKIGGTDSVTVSGPYWNRKVKLTGKLSAFRVWQKDFGVHYYSTRNPEYYIRMPERLINKTIDRVFPPEPDSLETLPGEADDYLVVDRQQRVSALLTVFAALSEAGMVKTGSNKLMTKSDFKRLQSNSGDDAETDEVAIATGTRRWKEDVSLESIPFLTGFFVTDCGYHNEKASMTPFQAEIVKYFIGQLHSVKGYPQLARMFLPGVDGITSASLRSLEYTPVLSIIVSLLKGQTEGLWHSVPNFVHRVYAAAARINDEFLIDTSDAWPSLTFNYSGYKAYSVTPSNAVRDLLFQFVRGVIFFLTALGVVEAAIERKPSDTETPFAALRYIRLTPLGLYALGRTEKVDFTSENKFAHRYELVDSPLIVVALDPSNPYNVWLDKKGTRRGNRWIITSETFLSGCNDAEDVKRAVEEFEKFICAKPSEAWTSFFDRLVRNAGEGSVRVPTGSFVMFEVNPDNRELLTFLTTDPEVRGMIYRAEGYRIIMPVATLSSFRQAMLRGGFLV